MGIQRQQLQDAENALAEISAVIQPANGIRLPDAKPGNGGVDFSEARLVMGDISSDGIVTYEQKQREMKLREKQDKRDRQDRLDMQDRQGKQVLREKKKK